MATPLLQTKLYTPRLRPELVPRPRLIERLDAGLHRKLTLISAPAGFGETTLLSEWINQSPIPDTQSPNFAWVSLDEGDNDPTRFLAYLIAALQTIEARQEPPSSIGKGALNALQSPQPPPIEAILTTLINEIAAVPDTVVLVFDDYHLIEAPPIHDALTFLLTHLPPQMHLVIATRDDPILLPLARLRARGQLAELRATDLRFTSSEAAEFLNQAMGLDLSAEDIAALETRTEGWIAGLQLAALSMQGHEDATSLIRSFTGSHRYVLDYLVEEVLEQQSVSVQTFLLHTAILDRLTGSLCDALTGKDTGRATLEMLERANLFIVSLDNERRWYRYHHLFADLLRQRLRQTQPQQVPTLHTRASKWYEQNGLIDEAIEHALRAKEFERTAHLIERVADAVWARGGYGKLRRWLDGLPVELVLSKPKLYVFRAWDLFASGRQDAAERFLQAAGLAHDLSTDRATETESPQRDQPAGSGRLRMRGGAAGIQAWIAAYRRHDISGLIQHLRQALEYLPERDLDWRSAAATTLGDAQAFRGDMPAAYQARLEALKACEAAGNTYLFMYNSAKLALNLKFQGRLLQVQELCQQRVRLANERLPHLRPVRPRGEAARFAARQALALAYWLVSGMECLRKGAGGQGSGGSHRGRREGNGDIDGGGVLRGSLDSSQPGSAGWRSRCQTADAEEESCLACSRHWNETWRFSFSGKARLPLKIPYERFAADGNREQSQSVVCRLRILGCVPSAESGRNPLALIAELQRFVGLRPTAPIDSRKEP